MSSPSPSPRPPSDVELRGDVEYEFGVPIPGRILPPEQWARTALKKPPEGVWSWPSLFGRSAPVVVDIGCGNARFVLDSAVRRPHCDHLGVDVLPVVIRYATRRANQRGLGHVRFAVIGGRELLERHVPSGSVAEIHVYHPQPYYTQAEASKRLITPEFLRLAHQALAPGGLLCLQTDHPTYWNYMQSVVPEFFEFDVLTGPWPESEFGRSRRELIAGQQKLPIFRGQGRARTDLNAAAAAERAARLPPPVFNADRRLQALDRIEHGGSLRSGGAARPSARRFRPPRKRR